jgi:hypothetical protein
MWEDWMIYLLLVLFFAQLLGYRSHLISIDQKMTAALILLTRRKDMIVFPITESEIGDMANSEAIKEWDEG